MRTNTIQLWLYLLSFLLLIWSCGTKEEFMEEPFIVTGQVTNLDGIAIEGVEVNSVVDTAFTDFDGNYSISSFPTGPIEYRKSGFESWTELVQERQVINVSLIEKAGSGTRYNQKSVTTTCDDGSVVQISKVEVSDFGEGTGTITWTKDKVWILQTRVFVNEGQSLTIEAGTIIKGVSGQAESAAALVVARGGKIFAEGTVDEPIIFTSLEDKILRDTEGNLCTSSTLTKEDKGLWGGVIILGNARLNSTPGETEIEGFNDPFNRGLYGGNDDMDNSGVLRYISIQHGGTQVTINKEINALTMAGVGSGTTIEYIEAYANKDDGFEWFGGTVNTRYLVAAFNGDDAFDYDEGWRGRNQFWLAYQGENAGYGGEHDGGTIPKTGTPLSNPLIANATFQGNGQIGSRALVYRDNSAGSYINSIFQDFDFGVDLEYLGPNEQDVYQNFADGLLTFKNNILFGIQNQPVFTITNLSVLPNDDVNVETAFDTTEDYFNNTTNGNQVADPELSNGLVPGSNSLATQNIGIINDPFFDAVNYRGCFGPTSNRWIDGWTSVQDDL